MIALVRVDNRLVHGQILETWLPQLRVHRIVVADDECAKTPLAQAAMCLCVPPGTPVDVVPLATVDWAALARQSEPVLVLLRDVGDLLRAVDAGLTPALAPRLNLGNVHFGPGRRPVTASVFLSDPELAAVRDLAARGFAVEARAIPSDPPLGLDALAARHAAAAAAVR